MPLFIESQCLADTAYGSVSNKVGNAGTFGFILLVGPTTQETRDRLEALQQRKTYQEVQEDSLRTAQIAAHNSPTTAPKSEIITPSMVSVAMLDNSCKVLRFSMGSEEEAYLLMHEVLKPLNSHLPGCNAYADRLNGIDGNILDSLSSSHPVNLLRQHDAISKK